MLEVLVRDVVVVQESDVRVGGLDLLRKREGKCCEPQHAEPAGMRPASRIANRDLSGRAGRMPEGAETGRGLNVADNAGKRGRNGLTFVPSLCMGPDEHGCNPRLPLTSCELSRSGFAQPMRSSYPDAASRKAGRRDLLI